MFEQVCGNIYWNISRKLLVKKLGSITGNLTETFLKSFSKYSYFHYRELFQAILWQVFWNICWNISRKLPVKILKTLHKILQKLFCKVPPNIQISVTRFQPIFPQPCRNIFRKKKWEIPTIIARKVSQTFPKYFVYGLDRGHKHLEQHLLKYFTTASCYDTWNITQNLAETFLQSFSNFSDLGNKICNQYFHNLAEIFPGRLQEMLRKHSQWCILI